MYINLKKEIVYMHKKVSNQPSNPISGVWNKFTNLKREKEKEKR